MSLVVVVRPQPIVSLAEAKLQLWIDADDTSKDAMIAPMIAAATAYLDGPAGWLGRALGLQTLEWRARTFGSCEAYEGHDALRLACPPIVAIVSVSYLDASGVRQTLDPSLYDSADCGLAPIQGEAWPATTVDVPDAVRVRYQAGYPDADGNVLPAPIKQAILMMVGSLYDSRDTSPSLSGAAAMLLAPYRVFA